MNAYISVSGIVARIEPVIPTQADYGCTLNLTLRSFSQGEINFTMNGFQISNSAPLNMILPNGQTFYGALAGNTVLVEYTAATRSIPAQIQPDRIIVFCYH